MKNLFIGFCLSLLGFSASGHEGWQDGDDNIPCNHFISYSNTSPAHATHKMDVNFADRLVWKRTLLKPTEELSRTSSTEKVIKTLFEDSHYHFLSNTVFFKDNSADLIGGRFSHRGLEDCLVIHLRYTAEATPPTFDKVSAKVDWRSFFKKDAKWDDVALADDNQQHLWVETEMSTLSWHWVDCAIHQANQYVAHSDSLTGRNKELYVSLYQKIKKDDLERSLARIYVTIDKNKIARFYSCYDDEAQKEDANRHIERISYFL